MIIPKRVFERFIRSIGKFQQVLKIAKDRDVNESDTVSIIKDMLAEIFGYDKYIDLTSEFAVRGTFCDLAIKIDNKVEYLIEAKAIGIELKESHMRQAIEYGVNNGVPWVILTNAIIWRVYKIRFEKPINYDLVCDFDFSVVDPKNEEHQRELFIICKEGLVKAAREEFHERKATINRFMLGALVLSDEIINVIRRELRKLSGGVFVESEEIVKVLTTDVMKRDVLEGEEAAKAQNQVRRFYGKIVRHTKDRAEERTEDTTTTKKEKESTFSDELLKQSGGIEGEEKK